MQTERGRFCHTLPILTGMQQFSRKDKTHTLHRYIYPTCATVRVLQVESACKTQRVAVTRLSFELPTLRVLFFNYLEKGVSVNTNMQMKRLLLHCSSSSAEQTLIG